MHSNIYLSGPVDNEDYDSVSKALRDNGWNVLGDPKGGIRSKLSALLNCEAICLLDTWWTDADSWCLQQAAGWMHLTHIDPATMGSVEMAGRQ